MSDSFFESPILVIDDEQANILLLKRILDENGFRNALFTTDPQEGLLLFKQKKFDLVLLDLNMPQMDGFDFLERFSRDKGSSFPPVLVLTALSDENTKLRALNAGSQDYLPKPFSVPEVVCRIKNLLKMNNMHQKLLRTNDLLEEKVQERTRELFLANQKLKLTQIELVKRLGRAAEYYDMDGGLHELRLSLFAEKLAAAVGIDPDQCENIRLAGPLHDFGKVGIPESILTKPGKLDSDEWKIMKQHPEIGAKILGESNQPLLILAKEIAWSHHEKWDGSGYPRGIKGENISLEARVVSICDTFDSLISSRYYRKAWSLEDAWDYIESERGKQFDPDLVKTFFQIKPEIMKIQSLFGDN